MKLRFTIALVIWAFAVSGFNSSTIAQNKNTTKVSLTNNLNTNKTLTEAQKAIPDEIAFEVFVRTVAENNAPQLLTDAGFDTELTEQCMELFKKLNSELEDFDKQAKDAKLSKNEGRNFLNDTKVKNELDDLQRQKTNYLRTLISINTQPSSPNSSWVKIKDFLQTVK
jgi:hypothetical protein